MDKTFYTRLDLHECTVVSDQDNLALHLVTYLEVRIECIPRVYGKLLETEGYPLLGLIEVEDDDTDLLVELTAFLRMVDPAP